MPHLETASLGVWIGSGSRDERPDEHGISHLLEHMAFKGTKRRSARQIAEEIEAVGGDLNAATSVETTAYFARVLRADVPLALDVLSDILSDPTFDADELQREQNVIVQEIGATEDTPDDLVFDRLQETAFPSQPIGRSILGTPETVRSFDRDAACAAIWRATIARPTWWSARRRGRAPGGRRRSRKRLARFGGPAAPEPEPARFGGGTSIESARPGAGAHVPRAAGTARSATSNSTACRCSPARWAAACPRACSRRYARSAGLLRDLRVPYALFGHRMFGSLCRHGRSRPPRADARRDRRDRATRPKRINEAEIKRAKAQMKAGLLMALESLQRAPGNWPARCSRMGAQFRSMRWSPRSTR